MPADTRALLRLEVPLIVQVAERRMSVDEVLGLVPGSIIELPKTAEEDLDVIVNNQPIGQGRALKVGENFGIRITRVGGMRERLAAAVFGRIAVEG